MPDRDAHIWPLLPTKAECMSRPGGFRFQRNNVALYARRSSCLRRLVLGRPLVFEAVAALVSQRGHAGISMTDIAERAGVAVTSLYRRWGEVRALTMKVATEQLMATSRCPTAARSRATYANGRVRLQQASEAAKAPRSSFQAFVATAMPSGTEDETRIAAMQGRLDQIARMLERARARGEQPPEVTDVMDHLLAPLYMRALFGRPANEAFAERLVERLLKRQ
jgi:AcrR family transcriptional regulator